METQNEAIEKFLSEIVSKKAAKELANIGGQDLTDVYNVLYEQMEYQNLMPEETTVKSLLQGLSDLSQVRFIRDCETNEEVSLNDFQDIMATQVGLLADLLGIELEG